MTKSIYHLPLTAIQHFKRDDNIESLLDGNGKDRIVAAELFGTILPADARYAIDR